MFRHQSCILWRLLHPKVLYSTAISPNKERARILIRKLSAEFEDIYPVMYDLENGELNNIPFDEWKSRISILKSVHFTDAECFKMISKYPALLQIPLEKLTNTTLQWSCSDLGGHNFHILLQCQPQLFEIDVSVIRKRLPQLRTLFRTSNALVELLLESPNVMYDNWKLVNNKINYLTKVRKFKMGDVMQSRALAKTLDFIKFRLDLLEKCGIYKQDNIPVHKLNAYEKSKHVNPSLKSILHINFNDFLEIAKISSEEYAVCKELFKENENDYDIDEKS